jgi:hypothetical protein
MTIPSSLFLGGAMPLDTPCRRFSARSVNDLAAQVDISIHFVLRPLVPKPPGARHRSLTWPERAPDGLGWNVRTRFRSFETRSLWCATFADGR